MTHHTAYFYLEGVTNTDKAVEAFNAHLQETLGPHLPEGYALRIGRETWNWGDGAVVRLYLTTPEAEPTPVEAADILT